MDQIKIGDEFVLKKFLSDQSSIYTVVKIDRVGKNKMISGVNSDGSMSGVYIKESDIERLS